MLYSINLHSFQHETCSWRERDILVVFFLTTSVVQSLAVAHSFICNLVWGVGGWGVGGGG